MKNNNLYNYTTSHKNITEPAFLMSLLSLLVSLAPVSGVTLTNIETPF